MKTLRNTLIALLLSFGGGNVAFGQATTTSTTLSVAVTANTNTQWCLASATGVVTPSLSSGTAGSILGVDREFAQVTNSGTSSTCFQVKRGQLGSTASASHSSGATVWVGAPSAGSGDPSRPFTGAFVTQAPTGSCVRSQQYTLPVIVAGTNPAADTAGRQFDCINGQWTNVTPAGALIITGGAQPSATSPSAASATLTVSGGTGGAQSATTGNGAAGAADSITGGTGGAGGSSSGTGGAGGAEAIIGGVGGGTVTGGAGGAATLGGGAGGAGSSAGGTGGALALYSGAAGSGGTGTSGAVSIKSGGAAGTSTFATSTAGATTVASAGTNQSVAITPSGSGKINLTGGTDPTKIVAVDASGQATALIHTLAFSDASTSKTSTFPNATGTVSLTATYACGTSATCSPTTTTGAWEFYGSVALSSASPSLATVTALLPAYTSTATYFCTATPVGNTAAIAAGGIAVTLISGSSFSLTGPNTVTTVVDYHCIGN